MGKWLETAFLQGRISPRFRLQTHGGSTYLGLQYSYLTCSYDSAGSARSIVRMFSHVAIPRAARFLPTIH